MKTPAAIALAAALALAACSPAVEPSASTTTTTPTTTETTEAPQSAGAYTGNDPFCLALYNAFEASQEASDKMSNVMQGLSDPAALAAGDMSALNELGRELADLAAHQGAFYTDALAETDDPEVREELKFFIDFVEKVVLKMGQAAADATSIEDYATRLAAVTSDPEAMELMERSDTVLNRLGTYASQRCDQ